MKTTNPVIDQFIINTVLIDPINDILVKLNKREFRDCDIKWLEAKLESYIKFACKTLGVNAIVPSEVGTDNNLPFMNDYVYKLYKERFGALLNYFKSF